MDSGEAGKPAGQSDWIDTSEKRSLLFSVSVSETDVQRSQSEDGTGVGELTMDDSLLSRVPICFTQKTPERTQKKQSHSIEKRETWRKVLSSFVPSAILLS